MTKPGWMWQAAFGLTIATFGVLAVPEPSQAGVFISVRFGPPVLPVYMQPLCPADGYIWTPGYWAYSDLSDYYWVPGTWVLAPQPGYLWTPPFWGFAGGTYSFHPGYWGSHIGFYGGVNYGYGYGGSGFDGGVWERGVFRYNRAYSNVNVTVIHNVYNRTVVYNNVSHVSYNGGPGGIDARASQQERMAERDHHVEATSMQAQHERAAVANRQQWASENHGRPALAASARPGEFNHAVNPVASVNHPAPVAHPQQAQAVHAQPQTPVHQQHAQAHLQQGQSQVLQPQTQPQGEQKPQHTGKPEAQKGEHGK